MRKIIAAINMTLDGFCDHTAVNPDDELMEYFNDLMRNTDTLIYGRTTYQLMESYWPLLVKNPSGSKLDDEFAVLMDNMSKIVYSRTLENVTWKNSTLKKQINKEEIVELKQQPGKNIAVGSPSMIVDFTKLGLIDEYQLVVHPVILGKGLPLFKNITDRVDLKLHKAKTFSGSVVVLYYGRKS
jgi:dihydrofolate reductase